MVMHSFILSFMRMRTMPKFSDVHCVAGCMQAEVFVRHNFPGVDHIPLGVEVKLPLAPVPSAATHIVSAATGAAVS